MSDQWMIEIPLDLSVWHFLLKWCPLQMSWKMSMKVIIQYRYFWCTQYTGGVGWFGASTVHLGSCFLWLLHMVVWLLWHFIVFFFVICLLVLVWLFDRLWVCIYIFVFVKNHQIWKFLNIHCSGQQGGGRQGWANTEVSCPAHHQSPGHNGIWPETWLCWANPWPHIPNALGQRQGVV